MPYKDGKNYYYSVILEDNVKNLAGYAVTINLIDG
jgi:hypothetical protein